MYKNILIATDGSELSGKGMAVGFEMAREAGAKVAVLTVTERLPAFDVGSRLGFFRDPTTTERYDADCRQTAEAILARAAEAASAAGVACETIHVANNAPARAILDTARTRGSDLIIVTSHGRDGFEGILLGSQALRVVEAAEIAVLVVR
ncbi:universal stress protein [Amaricoccus sp.]|uniref:universal stress protein n=1 Tax=Amaricoccus sp. TaxID=1872485 RepID=UPI001B7C6586|nr:universal stress protein [Amaricoccus sp.]MBP7241947.1 universal stress protein [Amaricoccus sp.]